MNAKEAAAKIANECPGVEYGFAGQGFATFDRVQAEAIIQQAIDDAMTEAGRAMNAAYNGNWDRMVVQ